MADLIQEFFSRDLSESELDSLDGLLKTSSEEVLRFEGELEKYYLATGLPQPQLPRSLHSLPHAGGWGGWIGGSGLMKMGLIVLAGAGVLTLWKYNSSPQATVPTPTVTAPLPTVARPKPSLQPAAKPALSRPSTAPLGPAPKGDELSVVVDTAKKALVTVRILDASGSEVRLLFNGFVDPGHWSFTWDGLLAGGQPASPGDYLIEVKSGSYRQAKKIVLKPNGT